MVYPLSRVSIVLVRKKKTLIIKVIEKVDNYKLEVIFDWILVDYHNTFAKCKD